MKKNIFQISYDATDVDIEKTIQQIKVEIVKNFLNFLAEEGYNHHIDLTFLIPELYAQIINSNFDSETKNEIVNKLLDVLDYLPN